MKLFNELKHLSAFESGIIEKLLSGPVTASIKIDTSAFVIMRDGRFLKFFGREGREEIDPNKRAVNAMYETFIEHVESTDWRSLPHRHKIYTELFLDRLPSIIKYTKKPKNNLIISYITDAGGKILKPDHPLVSDVAKTLEIAPSPVIFSGTLSSSSRAKLKEYTQTGDHGYPTFLEFVFSLFTPPTDLKWLVKDGFEGVVLYFGSNEAPVMAKLVDPNFTSQIKDKKASGSDEDSYYIQLSNEVWGITRPLMPWIEKTIEDIATGKKRLSGATHFLQFCAALSGEIIRKYGNNISNKLADHKDEVIGSRFFQLAPSLVPKGMMALSGKFWFAQDVFSILVNGLRNMKTRVNPKTGLDSNRKDMMNRIIQMLQDAGIAAKSNITSEALQILNEATKDHLTIIPGRFQPFHIGHQKMSQGTEGFPVYVIIKGAKSSADKEKNPFSVEDQKRFIKKAMGSRAEVMVATTAYIPALVEQVEAEMKGKVVEVIAGDDRIADYTRQISKTPLVDQLKFTKAQRFASATDVRNAIKNGDLKTFKKLMPSALHSDFETMKSILEN